jgi:hypothetical protein
LPSDPEAENQHNQKIVMDTSACRAPATRPSLTLCRGYSRGHLAPGTRLPTHRELAAREGLALVTASRVYAELEAMGLVSGETGRGTFVRETPCRGRDRSEGRGSRHDRSQLQLPVLPGQADLLRTALRQLALSGDLEACCAINPTPDDSMSVPRWRGICRIAGCRPMPGKC